jgi:hypothetical protein
LAVQGSCWLRHRPIVHQVIDGFPEQQLHQIHKHRFFFMAACQNNNANPLPFLGWDKPMNDILEYLNTNRAGFLIIFGPSGVGKTSIALAALKKEQYATATLRSAKHLRAFWQGDGSFFADHGKQKRALMVDDLETAEADFKTFKKTLEELVREKKKPKAMVVATCTATFFYKRKAYWQTVLRHPKRADTYACRVRLFAPYDNAIMTLLPKTIPYKRRQAICTSAHGDVRKALSMADTGMLQSTSKLFSPYEECAILLGREKVPGQYWKPSTKGVRLYFDNYPRIHFDLDTWDPWSEPRAREEADKEQLEALKHCWATADRISLYDQGGFDTPKAFMYNLTTTFEQRYFLEREKYNYFPFSRRQNSHKELALRISKKGMTTIQARDYLKTIGLLLLANGVPNKLFHKHIMQKYNLSKEEQIFVLKRL